MLKAMSSKKYILHPPYKSKRLLNTPPVSSKCFLAYINQINNDILENSRKIQSKTFPNYEEEYDEFTKKYEDIIKSK